MTKTRAVFTINSYLLLAMILSRFFSDAITDNALIVFILWRTGDLFAALSEDLTGRHKY